MWQSGKEIPAAQFLRFVMTFKIIIYCESFRFIS